MTALLGLGARLRLARLYLCTDARTRSGDLAEFLAAALRGGVDIVQLWQPGLDPDQELAALETCRAAAKKHQALVVAYGSADLAARFDGDLLHLGPDDGASRVARRKLHRYALLGRTAQTPKALDATVADGDVDYFSVGPVYATPTVPDARPVGLDLVRYAARLAPVAEPDSKPWFAIGGIGPDTIDEVIEAGARRVAVVRAITEADDPEAAARRLSERLRQAWRDDPAMEAYTFAATAWSGPDR